jgi:class 3 adenylate cyclase
MWLFATPLMIQIYCDVNHMKLIDTNIQYHIIPVAINIFVNPYKHYIIYYWFIGGSFISIYFFMKNLYTKRELLFTTIYLFIWGMFIFLTSIESLQIIDPYTINIYYTFADMIGKITTNIMINDYTEKEYLKSLNMDLQTIQFISCILKHIKQYEIDNIIKTPYNIEFIESIKYQFIKRIPEDKTALEQELLKKILPLNLHKEYLSTTAATLKSTTKLNTESKSFNMICILFTDIVNYTELANKYNDTIIFTLLSSIYTLFDTIIKQFPHLQKIETIGDAYMVVGDIFKTSNNHLIVIKEIIEFALTMVREVKTIQTPDNIPLCIRIGIHMGNVSIGILGNEIPRLCVVGNAVNVASRLQSTAEVDTIQFSKHVYEHFEEINFKDSFEIVKKENVFLKNLGSITTYNIVPSNK